MPDADRSPHQADTAKAERRQSRKDSRRPRPLYPFLFSIYPVLHLYLRNIREVRPAQVLWAAAASLAIAFCAWFLTGIFSRRSDKRALALFIFVGLFHSYGIFCEPLAAWLPFASRPLPAHLLAFLPLAIAWLGLSILVFRSRRDFSLLQRILQTTAWLLLAWNIGAIAVHHAGPLLNRPRESRPALRRLSARPSPAPDIYCFVLDEFASPEQVRLLFGYDNSAFVASLRRQGFFVAERSRSPYTLTEPAIAAILNLGEFSGDQDPFPQVRRNAVAALLKDRGYRIIDFACQRPLFLEAADRRVYYPLARVSLFFDDYYRALIERSLLRVLSDLWKRRETDLSRFYRERILQVFAELPAVVREPGPKLVYVHLFSPHEPFVFDARGLPVDAGHIWDHADPAYYLGQYAYVSRRMGETAAMILAASSAAPVIIMQSDHGYRGSRRRGKESRPVSRSEMTMVFNALYLPGVSLTKIPPALSPLNNFRLVFNTYFGSHYPLLRNP